MRIECFMPHLFFSIVSFSASLLVSPYTIGLPYTNRTLSLKTSSTRRIHSFCDQIFVGVVVASSAVYFKLIVYSHSFPSRFILFPVCLNVVLPFFSLQSVYFFALFWSKINDSMRCYFIVFCIVFFVYFRTPLDRPYRINLNNRLIK